MKRILTLIVCAMALNAPCKSQTLVEGEVCNAIWGASGSPYILSNDIIIPNGCYLTIEEGVEVYGVDYNFTCFGSVYIDGNADNRCVLSVKNFINHGESLTMNYCDVLEYETHNVLAFLSSSAIVEFANNLSSTPSSDVANFANSANGEYFQDFNSEAGWTANAISSTGTYPITNYYENGQYLIGNPGTNASGSGCNSIRIYSPQYSISEMEIPLSMDISFGATTGSSINVSMSINNGPYESIGSVGSPPSPGNYSFDIEVLESTEVDNVQFQFHIPWCGAYGQIAINSFDLITNFSVDENGYSLGEALAYGVSTSGCTLSHCNLAMDNFIVSDEVEVLLDSVTQTYSPQIASSGLEIFCREVSNLTIACSDISGFGNYGVAFYGPGAVDVSSSQIHLNTTGGVRVSEASFSSRNASFSYNSGYGLDLSGSQHKTIDFSNICFNEGVGLKQTGGIVEIANSILWSNDSQEFTQVANTDGLTFIDYTCIQGGLSYGLSGATFDLGSSILTNSPLFDDEMHLGEGSPCIDAANPTIQDSCIPPGTGSSVADLGMFGGENCDCVVPEGCTDDSACNYSVAASIDDGSCLFVGDACDDEDLTTVGDTYVVGCLCLGTSLYGCTDIEACNYNEEASLEDGSCDYVSCLIGCMEPEACNFDPLVIADDGSCDYSCCPGPGCCDDEGMRWDEEQQICVITLHGDLDFDLCVGLSDLLEFLAVFGQCAEE